MSPQDSLDLAVAQFKYTIALMYQAMLNLEPIMERQIEVIVTTRLLGNIFLFVCFLTLIVVLLLTHKEAQHVLRVWDVKIKRRWYIIVGSIFAVSLLVFNTFPGYALLTLEKQLNSQSSTEETAQRLFAIEQDFNKVQGKVLANDSSSAVVSDMNELRRDYNDAK